MTAETPERTLRIGAVAHRLGVTARTIRYYEELGLLPIPSDRSKGTHRLYGEADIAHLQEVLRLRDLLGLSLDAIVDLAAAEEARAALRDAWDSDPSDADRLQILSEAQRLIERQLELVSARQKTLAQFARDLRARLRQIEQRRAELTATQEK
jgi:MerR family transcriptional regulator, repressor of the yfmOP operon